MKFVAGTIAGNIASTLAVCGAVFLSYYDKPGWGWLLFIAVLLSSSIKTDKGQR